MVNAQTVLHETDSQNLLIPGLLCAAKNRNKYFDPSRYKHSSFPILHRYHLPTSMHIVLIMIWTVVVHY